MRGYPGILRSIILAYVALSFYEPFWRLMIRGGMEPNFSWGYMGLGGTGVAGDYWVIPVVVALGVLMLFFGWRGGSRVAMWGMFAWIALLFFSSLALVISDPGAMVQAETLQTEFPYAWVIFPFDALFFVLMAVWMIRFSKTTPPSRAARWNHVNSVLIAVAVALLPVEYALLNGGEQHGLLDGAGITVTLVQWIMLNLAFYPWKTSTERRREA